MELKDSGNRREFETGAVRDMAEGKGRCDLMPLDIVGLCVGDNVISALAEFKDTGDEAWLDYALDKYIIDKHGLNCGVVGYYDLKKKLEYEMFLDLAKHFEDGAKKYGENNWQKGIPVKFYIDSAVRHYLKFKAGWDDEPHDRAFVWNIICALWTIKHHPELNDYSIVKEEEREEGDRRG